MYLSSPSSDSHRAITLSTIHQRLLSPRAIDFSCSKHFAVLEILISRFSLPHSAVSPSSDGASGPPIPAESRYCVPLDFQVCDGGMYGKWEQIAVSV